MQGPSWNRYKDYLEAISSLSGLFSDSSTPYLHYRNMENIFCHAFDDARNLARNDMAYDAVLRSGDNTLGIGLKTFIAPTDKKMEKIAEFNKLSHKLNKLPAEELITQLARHRNARIRLANSVYGITEGIYHCVARREKQLLLFQEKYHPIDTSNIRVMDHKPGVSIAFKDHQYRCEYRYNFSKSTLFKNFLIPPHADKMEVAILPQPYEILNGLQNIIREHPGIWTAPEPYKSVILPLYSTSKKKEDGSKLVPAHSGLNQWNAAGRPRHPGEVYIPVPKRIHHCYPHFFPPRDQAFKLKTPTGEILDAKLCQDGSKAIMTNPNKALADWLLRGILHLREKEILKYERLLILGIDSVKIRKLRSDLFDIDVAKTDSYEAFLTECPNLRH